MWYSQVFSPSVNCLESAIASSLIRGSRVYGGTPPYTRNDIFIAIHTCKHTAMNESTVGAGAYTGPWAEVVFGHYKGGTFIAMTLRIEICTIILHFALCISHL